MENGNISFEDIRGFNMTVRYEDGIAIPERTIGQHVHAECEIYVHLGGDVSFMVEDQLYPIQYGNVVITRPYEYHHCIYHKTTKHRHFWILFSGEDNERILNMFFGRQKGKGNLLSLTADQTIELTNICERLCRQKVSEIEKYFCFFRMLHIMENAEEIGSDRIAGQNEVASVIQNIHRNYGERLTVKELAREAHISISTLERWFAENLDMTPSGYIKKIRLANAARMLSEQCSVTEAADRCGFSDVSAMISLFKKQYGMTPLQYKKQSVNE